MMRLSCFHIISQDKSSQTLHTQLPSHCKSLKALHVNFEQQLNGAHGQVTQCRGSILRVGPRELKRGGS